MKQYVLPLVITSFLYLAFGYYQEGIALLCSIGGVFIFNSLLQLLGVDSEH